MNYETASDMFLDNRRGLEDDIKHLNDEDKERVFNAYDWAVSQALTLLKSYNNFKEELNKRCDKELVDKVEIATTMRFMELGEMVNKYNADIESEKRVGYSQAEQED